MNNFTTPPELQDLEARYEDMYNRYMAGELGHDEFMYAASALVAFDGNGIEWRLNLNEEGGFVTVHNGEYHLTPVEDFAPLTVPQAMPIDNSNAFAWTAEQGTIADPIPTEYTPTEHDPGAPVYSEAVPPSKTDAARDAMSNAFAGLKGRASNVDDARKSKIIVSVAAVALILAALGFGRMDTADEVAADTDTSEQTENATSDDEVTETTIAVPQVISVEGNAPQPTTDRTKEIIAALISADLATTQTVMVAEITAEAALANIPVWEAVRDANANLTYSSPLNISGNEGTVRWLVMSPSVGADAYKVDVEMVYVDGTWMLKGFPTMTETGIPL